MKWTARAARVLMLACAAGMVDAADGPRLADLEYKVGETVATDPFTPDLDGRWVVEAEKPGTVKGGDGVLEIDVPGGCTVWWRPPLSGPVTITFEVMAVSAGGANDRVSDVNCFWMARDARSPEDLFATRRGGRFAEYDHLRCYYVGLGGNANTTTRFRRYIGVPGDRPLRPEHDLSAPEFLLRPNVWQTIRLVAAGSQIAYDRDGRRLFTFRDPEPYTSGWFGFRTVKSHLRIRNYSVNRLVAAPTSGG